MAWQGNKPMRLTCRTGLRVAGVTAEERKGFSEKQPAR